MTTAPIFKISEATSSFLDSFLNECHKEFGAEIFNKWFAGLDLAAESSSEVILSAPSKFIRDWVIREFIDKKKGVKNLLEIAKGLNSNLKKISVIHSPKAEEFTAETLPEHQKSAEKVISISKNDNVFAFGVELNPRYTFKNFISAKYNKLALSMAKIAAKAEGQIDLFEDNIPLFIHGGVGLGKTHLAQAIAWHIKENNKSKRVVYLSAEKFMYHFVQAVRSNGMMDFKEKMRSIDVLIVDDVQFIAGKESTQQEFMNSFNHMVEENKQVILVCDRCPSDLENIDEKLKSRISGGMIVNFKNPDYQDRVAILEAKSQILEQQICSKTISFLAEKITSSVRDLEGALKKLIAGKVLLNEEINLDSAKSVAKDYSNPANDTAVTIEKIKKTVASFYEIKIADLSSSKRNREIVRPRQIAMYLSKALTTHSLPQIGKEFGGKNHATVIHAFKLVQDLMSCDALILKDVKALEEKLVK